MSTIWSFDGIENKHVVYRGKDCMKKFCESLREHAMKVIKFENKKIPLTSKEYKLYLNSTNCHICKKCLKINTQVIKIIVKIGTINILQVNTEVLHIAYVI